jgi:hypothetical protein
MALFSLGISKELKAQPGSLIELKASAGAAASVLPRLKLRKQWMLIAGSLKPRWGLPKQSISQSGMLALRLGH